MQVLYIRGYRFFPSTREQAEEKVFTTKQQNSIIPRTVDLRLNP